MRRRVFLSAALLVLAFLWVTARAQWSLRAVSRPLFRAGLQWAEPAAVHGAGLQPDEINNIDIYKTARTATVYITSTTVRRDFFYQAVRSDSIGSGFLVNDSGFILTNFHVISGSSSIQVTLADQTRYTAHRLDTDRSDDLALIKIEPKKKQSFLRLGDSDHLSVGQKVLAIGNPFGLEGTLTVGVVSSIGRSLPDQGNSSNLQGMIQTDAAINGGNSGGPLLDSEGNVIGINTAILGQTNLGVGFAMPINRAKALLSDFQAGRITERPKVGVTVQYVAGDLAEALDLPSRGGLLVQNVLPGTSEEAAGLQGASQVVIVGNSELGVGGDLITDVDGQPVDREDALIRAYAHKRVGDTISVTVTRNGRVRRILIRLKQAPIDSEQQ